MLRITLLLSLPLLMAAQDDALGKLSEKYESGNRGPGTVSTGRGDPGGVSYGSYQLASKIGRADEFVTRYYMEEFAGLKGGTEAFTKKWKELAERDAKGLRANEHAFIKETHYEPQVKKLAKDLKLDVTQRSVVLRDVVWSVAVHHGPQTDVITAALKPLLKDRAIEAITDEAIIKAVYAERGRMGDDGKLARFKRVDAELIPALAQRFQSEQADALKALKALRPPIVLFLADDLSWSDCSPYGGPAGLTPNMARLAKDGITLTLAFVASPSCAPSRASLLTGLSPMHTGAMLNHAKPKAELKKWPAYFQDLGYEVVAIGKTAHYAQAKEYGFDHASHFKYHEDDCVEAACQWLAQRKSAKPLCLIVGTNWPHVPWPEADDAAKFATLPPTLVDTLQTRSARGRYTSAVAKADRDLGAVYDAARKHLGAEALFLFSSDHGSQFPFGKWTGYDSGVRVPLVAAWPGRIKPGTTSNALVSWIDILPTCLAAAGATPPAMLDGQSFLPVLRGEKPTHRERVFITHSGDGTMNRYPLRAVRDAGWKYIRNLDPAAAYHTHVDQGKEGSDGRDYWDSWVEKAKSDPAAAAVIKRYHTRPTEELYDVRADAWELTNLAAEPRHAERLQAMRATLDHWMKSQGDAGMPTEEKLWAAQAKKVKP